MRHLAVAIFDTVCSVNLAARQQLIDIVELCQHHLPDENAREFLMRKYLGMAPGPGATQAPDMRRRA